MCVRFTGSLKGDLREAANTLGVLGALLLVVYLEIEKEILLKVHHI